MLLESFTAATVHHSLWLRGAESRNPPPQESRCRWCGGWVCGWCPWFSQRHWRRRAFSAPSWSTDEFQLAGLGAHSALQEVGQAWVEETVGRAARPMAWRATLNPKHGEVPPDLFHGLVRVRTAVLGQTSPRGRQDGGRSVAWKSGIAMIACSLAFLLACLPACIQDGLLSLSRDSARPCIPLGGRLSWGFTSFSSRGCRWQGEQLQPRQRASTLGSTAANLKH